MTITKRNTIICDQCGKFCKPYDEYIPFGCKNYDAPEPLDPMHVCKKCHKDFKSSWRETFKRGFPVGDWQKSNAEMDIAREFGLTYVWSNGVGTLCSKDWADPYQYIKNEEYQRLSELPYYGYCKVCGTVRKGGYCSNDNCEESFKLMHKEPT